MYHKVPLIKSDIYAELDQKKHSQRFTIRIGTRFSQFTYNFHHAIALSSKHRMKKTKEASYDTYPKKVTDRRAEGSMTLEMVVILPLVVSFLVFFLFLFRVLLVQERMEEALVYTSRTLAVNCFHESEDEQKTQAELMARALITFRKGLETSDCPVSFVSGGTGGISLLSSELTGDQIILRASYEMRMPCVLLGSFRFSFVQCAQSRKWIGDISLEQGADTDDEWVYLTPYGTVYHRDRLCRYLDLSIRAVNRKTLGLLRNADREIYRKCGTCGDPGGGMVYVTDYGTHFHSSLSCSGLKRTIYMVKLSQTGGRKPCSKCGIRQS